MEFFDLSPDFLVMFSRLLLNVLATFIIIDRMYYRKSHRRDFYFTFMLIPIAIFFIVFFMIFVLEDMKGKTSMGVGIGLFGIFSIMRYRTDTMPVREMTYLFVITAVSDIGAIDFLRDMAMIRVSYEGDDTTSIGSELKLSKDQLKEF